MLPSGVTSLSLLSLASLAKAATVTYNWDITWVWAAPDGFGRPLIGVNNVWPCPKIEATVGDTVIVNVNNKLGNETTGLHFHGINQVQSPDMDGPSGVTQCPVPPGSSVKYEFQVCPPCIVPRMGLWLTHHHQVDTPGSFWYHSHNMGQYPDGLRGVFIVHDPNDPYANDYDEEVIITVSDW